MRLQGRRDARWQAAQRLARTHNREAGGPLSGYGAIPVSGREALPIGWQKITVEQARAWIVGELSADDLPRSR